MKNYKDLDVETTAEAKSALRAMHNCKHLETTTVDWAIICLNCGKQFSEQEYTDFIDNIKRDTYTYMDSFQLDNKTGWPKHIAREVEADKYE